MEIEQQQKIADRADDDGLADLEHVVIGRIDANADEEPRRRIDVFVRDGQQLHPQTDRRHVEHDQDDVADPERGDQALENIRALGNELRARHDALDHQRAVERLSICRSGTIQIVVNAYRDRASGPFSPAGIDCFEAAASILMASLEKHQQLAAAARGANAPSDAQALANQLAAISDAGLGEREAQVLASILTGMDQNAIAKAIGVKTSTVVTFRRHGHAKLGVRNRAELRARAIKGGLEGHR